MVKIGMLLHPERGVDAVFEEAKLADEQGYDSIWLGDHIMAHGDAARPDAGLRAEVSAGGRLIANPVVQPNPETGGTRLVFQMVADGAPSVELSAVLKAGDRRASETWLYRWAA